MSEPKKELNEQALEKVQGGFNTNPNGGEHPQQETDHCLGCMKAMCEGCAWYNGQYTPTPNPKPSEPYIPTPRPNPYIPSEPGTYNK